MSTSTATPSSAPRAWWRDAVIYQIYVRSFADADGDGRGDLQGIIDHLDHLQQLRVDAVWLCPCYPSPQLDHGYDVADYFDIEPSYGDLATFDRLVAAAGDRNIKVLMDVVPNHCSSEHAWFKAALRASKGSPERERFYFRDGRGDDGSLPPNNWPAVFGGPAWTRITEPDGKPGQWYLHTFTPWQPDFNWGCPDVIEHFDAMLRFWFDRGVEGFRVDAVAVAGKTPGLPDMPALPEGVRGSDAAMRNIHSQFRPEAHSYWRHWRSVIDQYEAEHPGRQLVTVSEAYTAGRPDLLLRFVEPDQFHQSFCFDLMLTPWNAPMLRRAIGEVHDVLRAAGAAMTWTLNNHDTQRAVTRYGRANATSPESYTGNNLVYIDAPVDLEVGTRRARAMFVLTAALPGSLYLYQGEELGLPEVLDVPDARREDPIFIRTEGREIGRDGCRIPMPWTSDPASSFGFSQRVPAAEPWLPLPAGWEAWAVDAEAADPTSMLALYREVLALRRALPHDEPVEWMLPERNDLVAFRVGSLLVALNVSATPIELPAELVGDATRIAASVAFDGTVGTVPGDSCVWLRAGAR